MKPWMKYGACGLGGLALGIVVAKYTLPPRVETRIEQKVVEHTVVEYKDRIVKEQGPVRVVVKTKTVPGPAGPTVEVEKIVEREKVTTVIDKTGSGKVDTQVVEKIVKVEDSRPWLALEGSGNLAPGGRWAGSGSVQARVLGPVWLGPSVIKADVWYWGVGVRWEF